ncbi:S41 family peptidase [Senegalia massiliensis]|uniref:Tail specific protease domain-containing protein n=1 Tax=Senegalia massiliensis TaxID=1720316 RepID=A0A845R227_9CLOT|nr:S41 family peptidase [Senegalia massiliensis]NBI07766.1 hypothetical protein [Senegalia massiliensis]
MKRYIFIIIVILLLVSCKNISEEAMSHQEVEEDIEYFLKTLDTHPLVSEKPELARELNEFVYSEIKDSITEKNLYFIVSKALSQINDAHTMIDIYSQDFRAVDFRVKWLEDGLFIISDGQMFSKGDKILKVGNKSINEVLNDFSKVLSVENENRLKFLIEQLLPTKMYLEYLNVINEDGTVTFKIMNIEGEESNIKLRFNTRYNLLDKHYKDIFDNPYYYDIDSENKVGVYYLNQCLYNDEFKKSVGEFFNEVNKLDIRKIAIDVRRNPGGDSRAILEIVKYLEYDQVVNLNQSIKSINKSGISYDGDIYILVSKETFSSGNGLAGVFKYNNLGILVGGATGNSTKAYGNTISFTLPNSKIMYNIATKKILIPVNGSHSNTIKPDINIKVNIDDILSKRDPVIKWLKYE